MSAADKAHPSRLGVMLHVLWWPALTLGALVADGTRGTVAIVAMGLVGMLREGQIFAGKMVDYYEAQRRQASRDGERYFDAWGA